MAEPMQWKVAEIVGALGGKSALARFLGVARSQPGRWISGKERPGIESQRRIHDLEYVWSRLTMVWVDEVARVWLESANAHLDGARPIDVLILEGPAPVIEAIDAQLAGSYA